MRRIKALAVALVSLLTSGPLALADSAGTDSIATLLRDENLDAAAQSIYRSVENRDWLNVVRKSRRVLTAPDSLLQAYPNTFYIYDWYVGALNSLGKYEKVPEIAHQGQQYAERLFRPSEKAYYNMSLAEIVAL